MRVLFVGHSFVIRSNQVKLEALADLGITVAVAVPRVWHDPELRWRGIRLEPPGARIRCYPMRTILTGRAGAYLCDPLAILGAIRDFRPDLIQVEQEVFSLCAFEVSLFARRLRTPLAVFGDENIDRPLSIARRLTRAFVMRSAALLIALNRDAAALFRTWGYRGPVAVMPMFGTDLCEAPAHRTLGCSRPFTIGYAGRITHRKGIDVLLRAAGLLDGSGGPWQMVVCGNGPDKESLARMAEELGIAQRVNWVAAVPRSRVNRVISQFDVLVLPSRSTALWKEQFGLVLIEAMGCGVPVIGSSCGAIAEVIGRDDVIFPEQDHRALAQVLLRMMKEPQWMGELSEYGRERVSQRFSHASVALQLTAAWKLLGGQ